MLVTELGESCCAYEPGGRYASLAGTESRKLSLVYAFLILLQGNKSIVAIAESIAVHVTHNTQPNSAAALPDLFQVYIPRHTGAGCLFSQLPSHRYHSHTPLSSLNAAFSDKLLNQI